MMDDRWAGKARLQGSKGRRTGARRAAIAAKKRPRERRGARGACEGDIKVV